MGRTTLKSVRWPSREIWTIIWTIILEPTRVFNFKRHISIGSAVFVGLTNVTNRQTDRLTTLLRV